jgi:hypothetical protein
MISRSLVLAVASWAVVVADARAHYLFIRILPPAEAGRFAEVYFSEKAEAGDPRFIDKIAHTQLWAQTSPGHFQALKVLKAADRLRAVLPPSGSLAVVGVCEYGVLARPKQVPFLLRHYPKAIAGKPEELNDLLPYKEARLEIMARIDGDGLHLAVLRDGQPVPGAVLETIDPDLFGDKLTADADGRVTWKPPRPGNYSVYTSAIRKESGDKDGKRYEEIREFATLAFAWPLARKGPDAKAVALFEEALATRAQWKDFPGFRAHIAGKVDGRPFEGDVTVEADGTVRVKTEEDVVKPWVTEQLESIVTHRVAGESSADRPKPVLRFADQETDHPLGRLLLFEGGRFASSYRVKDRQIAVVNRHLGRLSMTITVLDNERNVDGLFLPHTYTVQYWDAATGVLQRTETVQDRWQRVQAWDLPASHTVTVAAEAGLAVRSFQLSKHALLTSK